MTEKEITNKEIEDVVRNIMVIDGPDGHSDGSDVITSFIVSIIQRKHIEWVDNYYDKNGINKL